MLDVIYGRCAGLTIRKRRITAAVYLTTPEGAQKAMDGFDFKQFLL